MTDLSPETVERMVAALETSIIAIDDWFHTYADDECDPAAVDASCKRIMQYGTLAYIAEVQQRNRDALAAIKRGRALERGEAR